MRYRSLDRLTDVPGLLCEPQKANGGAVVIVHGGPTWHHSNEWDPLRQSFVDAGYVVLHPNYRGSDGYGRTWQLANRYLVGQERSRTAPAPTPSSSRWAATPPGSPSPAGAGAAS